MNKFWAFIPVITDRMAMVLLMIIIWGSILHSCHPELVPNLIKKELTK